MASTTASSRSSTCMDTYQPDDQMTLAHVVSGPEYHVFILPFSTDDHHWAKFDAQAGYVYQIDAAPGASPAVPVLHLYDEGGNLLAANDHYFANDAEIWWWNNGADQTLYVETTEARELVGCDFNYTFSVTPWAPGAFQAQFGNQ